MHALLENKDEEIKAKVDEVRAEMEDLLRQNKEYEDRMNVAREAVQTDIDNYEHKQAEETIEGPSPEEEKDAGETEQAPEVEETVEQAEQPQVEEKVEQAEQPQVEEKVEQAQQPQVEEKVEQAEQPPVEEKKTEEETVAEEEQPQVEEKVEQAQQPPVEEKQAEEEQPPVEEKPSQGEGSQEDEEAKRRKNTEMLMDLVGGEDKKTEEKSVKEDDKNPGGVSAATREMKGEPEQEEGLNTGTPSTVGIDDTLIQGWAKSDQAGDEGQNKGEMLVYPQQAETEVAGSRTDITETQSPDENQTKIERIKKKNIDILMRLVEGEGDVDTGRDAGGLEGGRDECREEGQISGESDALSEESNSAGLIDEEYNDEEKVEIHQGDKPRNATIINVPERDEAQPDMEKPLEVFNECKFLVHEKIIKDLLNKFSDDDEKGGIKK